MNSHELLENIVQIFNTGDVSRVESIFSHSYIDHQKPEWLDMDGPEEFRQIVLGARRSLPNLVVTIKDCIIEGDKIVARLHWHSVDEVGKTLDRETIDILHTREGEVIEHWGAEAWSITSD